MRNGVNLRNNCNCLVCVLKGEHCPCGAWVTPAFHVQKSKVDACSSKPLAVPSAAVGLQLTQSVNRLPPSGLTIMNSPDGRS